MRIRKDIDSYPERTGLTGDKNKNERFGSDSTSIILSTCNAADLLAANSAQTEQEHFVREADLALLGKDFT